MTQVTQPASELTDCPSYRMQVWTFVLDKPTFKLENNAETVTAPGKCRIVACKSGDAATK